MVEQPEEKTIFVGFDREFSSVDDALDWIREQPDYKDKSVNYLVSCDRTVEI